MPYRDVAGILLIWNRRTSSYGNDFYCLSIDQKLKCPRINRFWLDVYFVDHTNGIWPQAASGAPFTSAYFQSKGDPITVLHEDMAAEQKARTTYDNILNLVSDPDVTDPIKFLRQREINHYQRFGEALRNVTERLNADNFYYINPSLTGGKILINKILVSC